MKYIHKCKRCSKEYSNYAEHSVYCSRECRKIDNTIKYNCDCCGKEFAIYPSKYKELTTGIVKNLYCSKECVTKAQTTKVEKICKHCGRVYLIGNCWKDSSAYCSVECYRDFKEKEMLTTCDSCGKIFKRAHKGQIYCSNDCKFSGATNRVECTCDNCGKQFTKIRSAYEKSKSHYCSKFCKNESGWSIEDEEYLKDNYNILSIETIANNLKEKRGIKAIRSKAQALGITQTRVWTDEEKEIVLKYYPTVPIDKVVEMLPNRTKSSIMYCAKALGVVSYFTLMNRFSPEETEYIHQHYLSQTDDELAENLNKNRQSIANKRCYDGLIRPREKSSYLDLSDYIRRNLQDWKQKCREEANYTCAITGKKSNLVIHHTYGFVFLINETIEKLDFKIHATMDEYPKEELHLFFNTFMGIQEEHGDYICITDSVHKLFHGEYGYGYNTPEQWEEFCNNYKNKKYKV